MTTAKQILDKAAQHMQDRAATYDKPEGERSMGATVAAFATVSGVILTEEQGWLFMALLKAVRSQQGVHRADSYEDGAAYFALAGEAAARDRQPPAPQPAKPQPVPCPGTGCTDQGCPAHYSADHQPKPACPIDYIAPLSGWAENTGAFPELPDGARVLVSLRNGATASGFATSFNWSLCGGGTDILRYLATGSGAARP